MDVKSPGTLYKTVLFVEILKCSCWSRWAAFPLLMLWSVHLCTGNDMADHLFSLQKELIYNPRTVDKSRSMSDHRSSLSWNYFANFFFC